MFNHCGDDDDDDDDGTHAHACSSRRFSLLFSAQSVPLSPLFLSPHIGLVGSLPPSLHTDLVPREERTYILLSSVRPSSLPLFCSLPPSPRSLSLSRSMVASDSAICSVTRIAL